MPQKTLILLTAAVSAMLPSCSSTPGRLTIPEVSTVERLVISWSGAGDTKRELVIEDAEDIERFLAFLRIHNGGWQEPWGTFPAVQYTVSVKGTNKPLLVIWVGSNWIGGREGNGDASDNRLRSLSVPERADLLKVLRIPKN